LGAGERIRKRDKIFRRLNDASKKTTFYVEPPTFEELETLIPMSENVDGNIETSATSASATGNVANSEFSEMIGEVEKDETLKEKVKLCIKNWIGTR
jgi:hypothetical protein